MPNVSVVAENMRGKVYARFKTPHVDNQPACTQIYASPGASNQSVMGCDTSCTNGCLEGAPSVYNPGPSFANGTHSVNLVRVHKATVHYSCVRALLILQRERLDDANANQEQRHTYALARVLMRPAPGHAYTAKVDFRANIMNGTYSQSPTGLWQAWQTGTTGLRTMDPPAGGPSPATLTFTGVTDDGMAYMPGQMQCWDPACVGLLNCWKSAC